MCVLWAKEGQGNLSLRFSFFKSSFFFVAKEYLGVPRSPRESQGFAGSPRESLEVPGNVINSQGVLGTPMESLGILRNPRESLGVPGNLRESLGIPAIPWDSSGDSRESLKLPGTPWDFQELPVTPWDSLALLSKGTCTPNSKETAIGYYGDSLLWPRDPGDLGSARDSLGFLGVSWNALGLPETP